MSETVIEKNEEIIQYRPSGVCSRFMSVKIKDGIIQDAEIIGGCSGNLQGIKSLIRGMKADEVISRLKGIKCGDKQTSCPDQLARCLMSYKNQKANEFTMKN